MSINNLNPNTFHENLEERIRLIDAASPEIKDDFYLNRMAKVFHPDRQYMKIETVTELEKDTKIFRFVPDPNRGTTRCAPFLAGQYLNIYLDIEGMKVNRAYSISSSPQNAKDGFYELTIKYVQGGLVSRYVLDNWKEGDEVELSAPAGNFYYQELRDAKTVICLAGGSGITPFRSMAKAIADGDESFNLVLLYGSRSEDQIIFKDEFDVLGQNEKIKVVHVLSDEEKEGFEHGFITAELIQKYAPKEEPYSVFVCGPQAMYDFAKSEIAKLGLAKKYVRFELSGELYDASSIEGYPGCDQSTVKITVSIRDMTRTVTGNANDTILQTLERNGISVPTSCRSGECGFCHSVVNSGKYYVPKDVDGRRLADLKFGGIHPCVTFPLSDIEIIVPADK